MKILLHDLAQDNVCHEEELEGEIEICRISSERPRAASFLFNCKVMSRRHAVLLHRNDRFYVKDLRSSNGTFVNGAKLEAMREAEIFIHDVLQFGVSVGNNYPLRVRVEFLQDCHSRSVSGVWNSSVNNILGLASLKRIKPRQILTLMGD